jgi:hypothetical protein
MDTDTPKVMPIRTTRIIMDRIVKRMRGIRIARAPVVDASPVAAAPDLIWSTSVAE